MNEQLIQLLLALVFIYTSSQLINLILKNFKLSSVVGELLAGVLISFIYSICPKNIFVHDVIDFLKDSSIIHYLGELGIIILLLEIGLETEFNQIVKAGKEGVLVALGGVLAPFLLLFALHFTVFHDLNITQLMFVGLIFAATSIGVTASVFKDLKLIKTLNAQIILSAAVLDDILGFILLSVMVGVFSTHSFEISNIITILIKTALFFVFAICLIPFLSKNIFPFLQKYSQKQPIDFLIFILILCFGAAISAQSIGLAPIIGAFTLGVTLDSFSIKKIFNEEQKIEDFIAPIRAFLLPVFFVQIGLSVDLSACFNWSVLLLLVYAIFSKLISAWLLLPFKTTMNRLIVGIGMIPRGEVGLVVASIGFHQLHLFDTYIYSILIISIVLTTIISPLLLRIVLK